MKVSPLIEYVLHLADSALILGHRNSEWTGHGPILEQDIALSNISLDLIGQSRNFYQYAAKLINIENDSTETTEDSLAYLRDVWDFRNYQLVEQPNGHWGYTILRQYFFSCFQYYLFNQLREDKDETMAAIAVKSLKETTYHLKWSAEWVIRLGDGTSESNANMKQALQELWPFTSEFFKPAEYEKSPGSTGLIADMGVIQEKWNAHVQSTLREATIHGSIPETKAPVRMNGKEGIHTEHLGYILAEMQFLQRAYPNCEW